MDDIILTTLSYGGKEHSVEVKILKYVKKLVVFIVPTGGRFGTIVIGDAEEHET